MEFVRNEDFILEDINPNKQQKRKLSHDFDSLTPSKQNAFGRRLSSTNEHNLSSLKKMDTLELEDGQFLYHEEESSINNLAKYEIIKENIMKSDQRWNLLKRNSYKEASHIMSLKISRDNNYAVSTNYKGALTIYDLNSTIPEAKADLDLGINSIGSRVQWSPLKNYYGVCVAETNGDVTLFNIKTMKEEWSVHLGKEKTLLSLDFKIDGRVVYVGDKSGEIISIDTVTQKPIRNYRIGSIVNQGHTNRISCIKQHPKDNNLFFSAGYDNLVYLWDSRAKQPSSSISNVYVTGETIDYKDNQILIGVNSSETDPLRLYDYRSFARIPELDWYQKGREKGETCHIFSANFAKEAKDNFIMASSSMRNELRFFKKANMGNIIAYISDSDYYHSYTIKNYDKGIYCSDISTVDDKVILGTGDSYVHVVDLEAK